MAAIDKILDNFLKYRIKKQELRQKIDLLEFKDQNLDYKTINKFYLEIKLLEKKQRSIATILTTRKSFDNAKKPLIFCNSSDNNCYLKTSLFEFFSGINSYQNQKNIDNIRDNELVFHIDGKGATSRLKILKGGLYEQILELIKPLIFSYSELWNSPFYEGFSYLTTGNRCINVKNRRGALIMQEKKTIRVTYEKLFLAISLNFKLKTYWCSIISQKIRPFCSNLEIVCQIHKGNLKKDKQIPQIVNLIKSKWKDIEFKLLKSYLSRILFNTLDIRF